MSIYHKLESLIKPFLKWKFLTIILLLIILAISLFLEIYFSWDKVFQQPMRYAADDGVYHMRLIENMLLGGHFPKRIFFDPATYFPYGTYIHFAPFYEYPLAGFIWIVGLGHPTLELINKIAPFYPPILGTLAVLVVYFIGRVLWGKWAGLASAFLAAISSPLLFRSLFGATDHHQAEFLYSSLTMLFLILAVSKHQGKKFLLWTVFSGISLALYFLVWKGALLFLFLIFLFILLYYFLEYLAGRVHFWIFKAGIIIFTITLVAISFFFNHPDIFHSRLYDIRYAASIIGGIAIFLITGLLGEFLEKKQINKFYLPLILFFLGSGSILITKFAFPDFFLGMIDAFKAINSGMTPYPLIRELVGEMAPLTLGGAFETFSCLFYLSFIPLIFFGWSFIKERKAEHLLLIIWFAVIVLATGAIFPAIGLRRYAYYLAIIVSLFCGFLIVKGLKFARQGLALWRQQKGEKNAIFVLIGSLLIIFNLLYFIFYPFPLNLIESFPNNLPRIIINAIGTASGGVMIVEEDWYETFDWLKNNTPDPGLDYYALYEEPPFNPASGKIYPYPYPETAYGILASWDVGHMLTYYAHRLPTASPFQLGIGQIKNEKIVPGEATFFIETDEAKAYKILSQLKTRYIIADFNGSYAYSAFPGKPEWVDNSLMNYYSEEGGEVVATENYDKSMAARLYLLDGRELTQAKKESQAEIKLTALNRYRLVYESKTSAASIPNLFDDNNSQLKLVKVFEYVAGAKITGRAPSGTTVEISTKVKTNQNREFVWKDTQVAENGKFEFTVPYSTVGKDGWAEGGTKFVVFISPYQIKIGNVKKEVTVSEEDIIRGNKIKISK